MMTTTPEPEARETKLFFRIMALSIAMSFGALSSSLVSLHHDSTGFHFAFGAWTVISFFLAAITAWGYWNLLLKFQPKDGRSTAIRRNNLARLVLYAAPLLVVGFFGFLYPLKFVSSAEKKFEIAQGLGIALFALSSLGFLLWRVTRFIDPPKSDDQNE